MDCHHAPRAMDLLLISVNVFPLKDLLKIIMQVLIILWQHASASAHISTFCLVLFTLLLLKQRGRKSNTAQSVVVCQSG